jgi:tail tube protein
MPYGMGAGGLLGVAFETVAGTYVAPTKFIPILSESLELKETNIYRTPIRQSAARIGVVPGDFSVTGTVTMEATEDCCLYFTECSRATGVKTGTTPNWIYTYTPNSNAVPNKTMSITVVRNGVIFGYVGCVVSKQTFTVNNNILEYSADIFGLSDTQPSPSLTPVWPTSVPYGPGTWNIQIPNPTQVFDLDTFSFDIDDAGQEQFRLKNVRGAQFASFGERSCQMTCTRDFLTNADYVKFINVTGQKVTVLASNGINNSIQFDLFNAIQDVYQIPLSGVGDLIRASITYQTVLDGTGNEYDIVYKTQETIVP